MPNYKNKLTEKNKEKPLSILKRIEFYTFYLSKFIHFIKFKYLIVIFKKILKWC